MDLRGQKLADLIYQILLALGALVGFVWGYLQQDFMITFYCWGVSAAAAALITIPDWPFFNRSTVQFLEALPAADLEDSEEDDEDDEDEEPAKTGTKPAEAKRPVAAADANRKRR